MGKMVISHILLALTIVPFAPPFAGSVIIFNNVLVLNPDNFDKEVGQDRVALVRFFNPWFNNCEELEYENTGASFKNAKNLLIGKVNCDEHLDLCVKYSSTSYPTFLWFPKYSLDAKRYEGPRTTEAFVDFVNTEAGTMVKQKKIHSDLVILTPETFERIVFDETKDVFVIFEYYTPRRDHCSGHDMIYEKLASVYKLNENIVVAILDAYKEEDVTQKYYVSSYPTYMLFPKGNKDGLFFKGYIAVDHFVEFINEKCGTNHNTKGQLKLEAGKVKVLEVLDELFKEFIVASINEKEEILTKIEEEVPKLTGPTARHNQVMTVYAPPSMQTRVRESDLDTSASVHVDGVISGEFSIGKVVQYVARKTWSDPLDFKHQISRPGQWLLKFPSRYQRDRFVGEESVVRIEGSLVQFRSWKSNNSASPFLFKKRVWLKLHNFPEHHYCFEKAAFLVASFGSLVEVDVWKIQGDLSTFDVMVDVEDVLNIPKLKKYAYDNYFVREVRIEVIEDVDIQWYMDLGLEKMGLSYVEKIYRVKEAITAKMEAQCKV